MVRRRDPVTHEDALFVFRRDRGCVAVELGESPNTCAGRLSIDHVREHPHQREKPLSIPANLVSLCMFHHTGAKAGSNWATSHRPELRSYLARVTV